jgi:hypothetical protein
VIASAEMTILLFDIIAIQANISVECRFICQAMRTNAAGQLGYVGCLGRRIL